MDQTRGWHFGKNTFLVCLCIIFLPLNTAVTVGCWLFNLIYPSGYIAKDAGNDRQTFLVTGVNMAKGLATARLLHRSGHRVIGADCHHLSLARVSNAIDRFIPLPQPGELGTRRSGDGEENSYIKRLLEIMKTEDIDIWISVSDVNAALHDARVRDLISCTSKTKCIQLGASQVEILHDKAKFMNHIKELQLDTPDTQIVASRDSLVDFLAARNSLSSQTSQNRYIVKPIGVNDVARFDMPLLPLASVEETTKRIASIPFPGGEESSFIIQEFIAGAEFCTHALVVHGEVRAFVACPSASVLMHYEALPPQSVLSQKMLAFTKAVAKDAGDDFTGHVSFDFLTKTEDTALAKAGGSNFKIYPIECNPRVHTAVLLFNGTPALVDEYLSCLSSSRTTKRPICVPTAPKNYYWIAQDVVEQVLYPAWRCLILGSLSLHEFKELLDLFIQRLTSWKDGFFETWDPWPSWWLYHVYWPLKFSQYLISGRWSKINISTGKEFQAE